MPVEGVPAVDGIRVGIGGWTYAPWRDNFYPKGLVQRRELEYASRELSAIEINGTYYGMQKPATYAKWREETPEGFVFSAKAPKRIMQSRALAKVGPQVDDFIGGIVELRTQRSLERRPVRRRGSAPRDLRRRWTVGYRLAPLLRGRRKGRPRPRSGRQYHLASGYPRRRRAGCADPLRRLPVLQFERRGSLRRQSGYRRSRAVL